MSCFSLPLYFFKKKQIFTHGVQWLYVSRVWDPRPLLCEIWCIQLWSNSVGDIKWHEKQNFSASRSPPQPFRTCKHTLSQNMFVFFLLMFHWFFKMTVNFISLSTRHGYFGKRAGHWSFLMLIWIVPNLNVNYLSSCKLVCCVCREPQRTDRQCRMLFSCWAMRV